MHSICNKDIHEKKVPNTKYQNKENPKWYGFKGKNILRRYKCILLSKNNILSKILEINTFLMVRKLFIHNTVVQPNTVKNLTNT